MIQKRINSGAIRIFACPHYVLVQLLSVAFHCGIFPFRDKDLNDQEIQWETIN